MAHRPLGPYVSKKRTLETHWERAKARYSQKKGPPVYEFWDHLILTVRDTPSCDKQFEGGGEKRQNCTETTDPVTENPVTEFLTPDPLLMASVSHILHDHSPLQCPLLSP